MPIYDATAQTRLIDKLDYEVWLLDFLAQTEDLFQGGTDLSTIRLKNNQTTDNVSMSGTVHLGAGYAQRVMGAMSPLVFTASYKVLDMVYEWILEENVSDGVIPKVPWRFSKKVALIAGTNLNYPPVFGSNAYVWNYSYAFFTNLLPYRNEVVHNHNFAVVGDKLTLTDSKTGSQLVLDCKQLGYLVRFVIAVAKCLSGKLPFDPVTERLLRYYLDQMASIHRLATFGQSSPLLVNVELSVPKEGEQFPTNLRLVRETVQRIHPNADVLFNLTVIGCEGDAVCAKWYIRASEVPGADAVSFTTESHQQYRQKTGADLQGSAL